MPWFGREGTEARFGCPETRAVSAVGLRIEPLPMMVRGSCSGFHPAGALKGATGLPAVLRGVNLPRV